ncbi:transglycosylase domain-containing protein [Jeotgalicoccus meleagridis]|uniref:Penicillin-binding protein 1F n=1 Tax=Jeotgalicoccus meleagridis TaxID=2759181 RepID=A0A6V7RH25_9STAP|nr:transglycosylase domain-containing protein [Jeotgalicoccus meleagridis]CAD2076596.1 Penicillin-binding protein 1F [Jeotgalicoccus meleagridis]HIW38835.1 penicillin-binding protein [Candidatus Jeotgalicoccus stercoravium]
MKKNDFIENIKKMFSRSDSEKKTDRIHGETAKDKYNNIVARFKKAGSPLRVSFFTAYDTIWNVILFLLLTVTLIGLFLFSIGLGYFAALVSDEEVLAEDEIKTNLTEMTESTTVTFGSGEELGTLRSDLIRETVKYDDISENVTQALIATEDEHFYEHNGVVPKAFMRASLQELSGSEAGSGGSTITQQLVKNQMLTNDPTFDRKATELLLAFRVENILSKEEILEAYLNAVSFGRNANGQNIAGIESAAEGVFGKSASELNIAESAFLAGLPQNPYAYTPFNQDGSLKEADMLEAGKNRQEFVLSRMLTEGVISQEEHDQALAYNIYDNMASSVVVPNQNYPFLTDEIERRGVEVIKYILAEEEGVSREDVDSTPLLNQEYTQKANDALRNQGYQIETTIDKNIYDTMQETKENSFYYYGERSSLDAINAVEGEEEEILDHEVGAVLKENDTGKILGFVGGRNYENSEVNHATQTSRQAGSTMKPLSTYAPAIDQGLIVPDTVLLDKEFNNNGYEPANYSGDEYGLVSAKHALSNSYNLSTLRLWSEVRNHNPYQYLDAMNMSIPEQLVGITSLPLGPLDTTVENNVDAFSTFGNQGEMNESYMIQKITAPDGDIVYEHQEDPVRVFKESTSFLVADMLKESFLTGSVYHIKDYYNSVKDVYDWSAKTGTSENFVDSWMIGFNPKVTLGIWMGYDRNIPQVYDTDDETHPHIYNWSYMADALSQAAPEVMGAYEKFEQPSSVRSEKFCALTMELEDDCSSSMDKPITGLIAEDTIFTDKSSLNDPAIQSRMGSSIDSSLSNSSLRGTVTRTYDDRYSVGGRSSKSSSKKDKDDD